MKLTKFTLAVLSAGTLCAGGFTSAALATTTAHEPAAKLPAETVQGQVSYVTGGVGHDEAAVFKRAERQYPLSLEFAQKAKPRSAFTANVNVMIRDANGKVALQTVAQGPYLLAKLPAGRYEIRATLHNKTLERHVNVAEGKPAHLEFLWPKA